MGPNPNQINNEERLDPLAHNPNHHHNGGNPNQIKIEEGYEPSAHDPNHHHRPGKYGRQDQEVTDNGGHGIVYARGHE